ncbi:hypothetical protein [uncultured Shewanella sp.]|uniref:hypothetical protein n=1 Tax=uncultured Shewanella sp. TaxID=173975 RepID=UPI002614E15C|nr:hypothetical protein [uncultured Shewanella sp.]
MNENNELIVNTSDVVNRFIWCTWFSGSKEQFVDYVLKMPQLTPENLWDCLYNLSYDGYIRALKEQIKFNESDIDKAVKANCFDRAFKLDLINTGLKLAEFKATSGEHDPYTVTD